MTNSSNPRIHLRLLIKQNIDHPLASTLQDVVLLQNELTGRIKTFRELQAIHMESIKHCVLSAEPCEISDEQLFLPSRFTPTERSALALDHLAAEEAQLRDGQAHDCIFRLRRLEKTLSAIQGLRKKQAKGQKESTRSQSKIQLAKLTRTAVLTTYGSCRVALQSLFAGRVDYEALFETQYPELSEKDLYRKDTASKRDLGDTHRPDGNLWFWSGVVRSSDTPAGAFQSRANSRILTYIFTDGVLWRPTMGISNEDLANWEREGKKAT